jgi:transcriptional regulator with XRE-family HTH domain
MKYTPKTIYEKRVKNRISQAELAAACITKKGNPMHQTQIARVEAGISRKATIEAVGQALDLLIAA